MKASAEKDCLVWVSEPKRAPVQGQWPDDVKETNGGTEGSDKKAYPFKYVC